MVVAFLIGVGLLTIMGWWWVEGGALVERPLLLFMRLLAGKSSPTSRCSVWTSIWCWNFFLSFLSQFNSWSRSFSWVCRLMIPILVPNKGWFLLTLGRNCLRIVKVINFFFKTDFDYLLFNFSFKFCSLHGFSDFARSAISRVPHMSIFLLHYFDMPWVWAESSLFSPPTQSSMYLYYLCLCRLSHSSLPILPYMPYMLFSLLLVGKPFCSWASLVQLSCIHPRS